MSLLRLCGLFVGLALAAPATAAAVPIDDFTDPGIVPAAGVVTPLVDTSAFTIQGGEPVAAVSGCPARVKTAWWRVIGNGLPVTAATDATTFDTVLVAFEATGAVIGTRVGCADPAGNPSSVTFPTARGREYLVQAGGKGSGGGAMRMRFSVTRPTNDDRAAALALGTGAPATVDQSGATQEAGETLACGASPYAATIWFSYTASEALDARFAAAGGDTVLAVYRAGEAAPLACNDDEAAGSGSSAVALRVTPGTYHVQVGARGADGPGLPVGPVTVAVGDRDRDRDGTLDGADCDPLNPGIGPGAVDIPDDGIDQDCAGGDAVNLDRDGDGFPRPADCRDDRADINPGARDLPGDADDQDCKGGAAKLTRLRSSIAGFFGVFRGGYTRVTGLAVRDAPKGAKITVTCKGGGCPAKRHVRTVKQRAERVNLLAKLRDAELRPGARLQVRVVRRGFIGLVTTWRMRELKLPVRVDRCLAPGARKPRRCRS